MRVLTRPPPSPRPTAPVTSHAPPQLSGRGGGDGGVVVVGFIGKRHEDVTQIINRIIDDNVFGSGNLDTPFLSGKTDALNEEIQEWFKRRSISYYYEEEKSILYLQFSSTSSTVVEASLDSEMAFDSAMEDYEFGDLQGLLFMFSVCHVVVYVQEGSHFDPQILKRFQVLLAAKHAMAPFVKSHCLAQSSTSAHVSSSSRASASVGSSSNQSPNRSSGMLDRRASAVTLMSGIGSFSSLLPGQCTPVILFVFLDDFTNGNPSSGTGEKAEAASPNQSSSSNNSVRPSLPPKASSSVVVLARPVSKPEGGFRKKLQSSLESQIRISIKKCRGLSNSEINHTVPRCKSISSSAPLFLLDASKVVALLSAFSNQKGESLRFATALLEDILDGKATSDSLLLEKNSQTANKEDILSVKEFIFRQSDIFRGRGTMVSSATSSSVSGAGMVAVAAAAAAASSASKKQSVPDLPSLETWLTSSQPILSEILSVKRKSLSENETSGTKSGQRDDVQTLDGNAPKVTDSVETAVNLLETDRWLNIKLSISCCEKALPVAKEIYLKDLPSCYPTSVHKANLERALLSFNSMVKGPAVQLYKKKLDDECTSIWKSGRQRCDAISLSGKPCMHKQHDLETDVKPSGSKAASHCSGYVFLHACACGRSRRLRPDPFDFEAANASFNTFAECDDLLPTLQLPHSSVGGHLSWSLVRIGGAKYYNPTEGLIQSGFSRTQKFLMTWTFSIGVKKAEVALMMRPDQVVSDKLCSVSGNEATAAKDIKVVKTQNFPQETATEANMQKSVTLSNVTTNGPAITSGRGISNATMRKPFSEVVAGSMGASAAFPPLQTRKPVSGPEKVIKHHNTKETEAEKVKEASNNLEYKKAPDAYAVDKTLNGITINVSHCIAGDPFLQIGSNVVPVSTNREEKLKGCSSLKHVTLYIGLEHECPYGHRFILSPDHLNDLGPFYALPEDSIELLAADNSDIKVENVSQFGKNEGRSKGSREANGFHSTTYLHKSSKMNESKSRNVIDSPVRVSTPLKEQKHVAPEASMSNVAADLRSICLDDGKYAFSLLNRNVPIYMNCPYCTDSKRKDYTQETKFAGTVSQLQRVFLVTPPFPVVIATCPLVQFQESCLPPTIPARETKLQFSLGCRVILPPDSFLSIRLPFIYGLQLEDGNLHPLSYFGNQPELTAWITKGTLLQVLSVGSNLNEGSLS